VSDHTEERSLNISFIVLLITLELPPPSSSPYLPLYTSPVPPSSPPSITITLPELLAPSLSSLPLSSLPPSSSSPSSSPSLL
jgi:hypothetical protein